MGDAEPRAAKAAWDALERAPTVSPQQCSEILACGRGWAGDGGGLRVQLFGVYEGAAVCVLGRGGKKKEEDWPQRHRAHRGEQRKKERA